MKTVRNVVGNGDHVMAGADTPAAGAGHSREEAATTNGLQSRSIVGHAQS